MTLKIDDSFLTEECKYLIEDFLPKAESALEHFQSNGIKENGAGWFDWPRQEGFKQLEDIEAKIESLPFYYDSVILIGIGGSYAGCQGIDLCLQHSFQREIINQHGGTKPIYYMGHNLSELSILESLDALQNKQPVVVVISKSGKTVETSLAFRLVNQFMYSRLDSEEVKQRTLFVTDKEQGALREYCNKEKSTAFPIPDSIGGRYSALTAVGLLPLSLAGYKCRDLLNGADQFYYNILNKDAATVYSLLHYTSLRRAAWELGKKVEFLCYDFPKLDKYFEWWKQLFAESEGKQAKGLLPVACPLSTDLHSFGQYMQEGPEIALETFVSIESPISYSDQAERRLRVAASYGVNDGFNKLEGNFIEDINKKIMKSALMAHSKRGLTVISLL